LIRNSNRHFRTVAETIAPNLAIFAGTGKLQHPVRDRTKSNMKKKLLFVALGFLGACSSGSAEDSAICGLTHLASANKVLDLAASSSVNQLFSWPENIPTQIPVRAVGYGTGTGIVGDGPDGVIVGFEGEGFPSSPGFGVALVDDSSEVFRGVLIYDMDVPAAFTIIGGVAGTQFVIPMYAFRINWSAVNDLRCPIFSAPDTTSSTED
jgi:hypothetical protein